MAREFFCAYHSYLKAIDTLNDAEKGRLFVACLNYSMTGEVPDLRGNERFIFPLIRQQIDMDREKYDAFCEKQRRNVKKRWDTNVYHGKSGIPTHTKNTKEKEKKNQKEKENISANADNTPLTPLEVAIENFKCHRKALKRPMTEHAEKLLRGKLEKMAPGDTDKQIALIDNAIDRGWQSVYPLDEDRPQTNRRARRQTFEQREVQSDELSSIFLKLDAEV